MELIQNHNCVGLCCHEYCGNDEEYFMRFNINGMKIIIAFCKDHGEAFEDKFWGYTDAKSRSSELLQKG